jgi:hypothetical protein
LADYLDNDKNYEEEEEDFNDEDNYNEEDDS